jgi:flagellar protein FlbD
MVPQMINLTRLTGAAFALNPDLVERVEETPDTVITLVDGTKYLVREPLQAVVEAVREYRASVLAAAGSFEDRAALRDAEDRWLAAVPAETDDAPVLTFPHEER